jgi:hypothetical protein
VAGCVSPAGTRGAFTLVNSDARPWLVEATAPIGVISCGLVPSPQPFTGEGAH